jgi:serine/threonine protein kinase
MSIQTDEMQSCFAADDFPADFSRWYEPLECLADKPECETFYVREKNSGRFAIAKCYKDKALFPRTGEARILDALHHQGIPRFFGAFENDSMLCVVREYVQGVTLDDWLKENPVAGPKPLSILLQLCDILSYLHTQSPPVIHRDIKPQNIVITREGTVKLIDFGISRTYNENGKSDTVSFGTQEFAAPEQYGFSQTDQRADLFSLGVVMGYLLTGKTEPKAVLEKLKDKQLASVYKKCTAFDPNVRFATAEKLKNALLRLEDKRRKAFGRFVTVSLACLLFLAAGFAIGRYTNFSPAFLESGRVAFEEPLIGKAVRVQLGKSADEPVSEEELLAVEKLYIFSTETAKTEPEINAIVDDMVTRGTAKPGGMHTLADLAKLPNLRVLFISMQQLEDISPVAGLPHLEDVVLKNNPIRDVSPLSGLPRLRRLSLFDTSVTDFSPLAKCPTLQNLEAGGAAYDSIEPFAALTGLSMLSLYQSTVNSLAGIERLSRLQSFEVDYVNGDLAPLSELPNLRNVSFHEDMRGKAAAMQADARFTIRYR